VTSFIPALLVKLTLILTLGLLISASLRAYAPSVRHLTLFAAISSSLALPVVMLLIPRWDAPILPAPFALTFVRSDGTAITSPAIRSGTSPAGEARNSSRNTNRSASNPALTAKVIDATRGESGAGIESIAVALPILWALGLIGILSWLAIGRIRLSRISRTSWPL
jgi:hypothetical protein